MILVSNDIRSKMKKGISRFGVLPAKRIKACEKCWRINSARDTAYAVNPPSLPKVYLYQKSIHNLLNEHIVLKLFDKGTIYFTSSGKRLEKEIKIYE